MTDTTDRVNFDDMSYFLTFTMGFRCGQQLARESSHRHFASLYEFPYQEWGQFYDRGNSQSGKKLVLLGIGVLHGYYASGGTIVDEQLYGLSNTDEPIGYERRFQFGKI